MIYYARAGLSRAHFVPYSNDDATTDQRKVSSTKKAITVKTVIDVSLHRPRAVLISKVVKASLN